MMNCVEEGYDQKVGNGEVAAAAASKKNYDEKNQNQYNKFYFSNVRNNLYEDE